jgi:N-acetylglucosamine-6-phosphate deacetylase
VIAPGFLDIHIHGSCGHDVMEDDPAALPAVQRMLAEHGVTGFFPTTVTAPLDALLSALDRLATAIENAHNTPGVRAQPLGIHLEGPFISHAQRGVHPPEFLLEPSLSLFEKLWQVSRGHIRLITIAPELPGALEVISEATKRGVCVSLGHSDADSKTTRTAIAAGARHATHTFNAMRPLRQREPGIIGEVLMHPGVTADLIADGVHLDPLIVGLILQSKGVDSSVLITDAISAAGMPDGKYHLGSLDVQVRKGKCLANGKLAGSVLTMDRAVRNVTSFAGWTLQQALRPATLNPARVIGLAEKKGALVPGADADMVVLTPSGDVIKTIVQGCGA